jgi:hypothetical protein
VVTVLVVVVGVGAKELSLVEGVVKFVGVLVVAVRVLLALVMLVLSSPPPPPPAAALLPELSETMALCTSASIASALGESAAEEPFALAAVSVPSLGMLEELSRPPELLVVS